MASEEICSTDDTTHSFLCSPTNIEGSCSSDSLTSDDIVLDESSNSHKNKVTSLKQCSVQLKENKTLVTSQDNADVFHDSHESLVIADECELELEDETSCKTPNALGDPIKVDDVRINQLADCNNALAGAYESTPSQSDSEKLLNTCDNAINTPELIPKVDDTTHDGILDQDDNANTTFVQTTEKLTQERHAKEEGVLNNNETLDTNLIEASADLSEESNKDTLLRNPDHLTAESFSLKKKVDEFDELQSSDTKESFNSTCISPNTDNICEGEVLDKQNNLCAGLKKSEVYKKCPKDFTKLNTHQVDKVGCSIRKTSVSCPSSVPPIVEEEFQVEISSEIVQKPQELNEDDDPVVFRTKTDKSTNEDGEDSTVFDSINFELLEDANSYKFIRDSLDISHKQFCDREKQNNPIWEEAKKEVVSPPTRDSIATYTKSIPYKKNKSTSSSSSCKSRRVSFPEDENRLITSYLEPANPWYQMNDVTTQCIADAYQKSCNRHSTKALASVLHQIISLPVNVGGRIERLNLSHQIMDGRQIECLEEIFRRVQFKVLDFESCQLDDDTAIPLFDMIEYYDSTTHLNISKNNGIGIRGWQVCARMLKRSPSLKILDARETELNESNMPALCRALRIGTRLSVFHLENCNLTGRPLLNLSGAIRLNDTITDLYLGDNRLGSHDCIQIGNLVRGNKTLKLVDLRNNNIQDSGCAHICKDIAEKANIQKDSSAKIGLVTLNLWNNHLTINSIPHLSNVLSASATLQTLNLGRNCLTNEGILLLKNALIRNRVLIRLGLQATRIGNEGAVAIAECIAENPVLSRIDLRENSIQAAGLMALSRSLAMNSNIIQLDLDSNPRAELNKDLSMQHVELQEEIKTCCQSNLLEMNRRNCVEKIVSIVDSSIEHDTSKAENRKISLTCETNPCPSIPTVTKDGLSINESKRYWSPAPSPSISPCPSPSLSPSPSPLPSPLKNRFKVFKVSEDNNSLLSTSAPASFSMSHSISGSLPSLNTSNRFLSGSRRFTVTRVTDCHKVALPVNRAMSSPSLILPTENSPSELGPAIVVSSPNKAIRGFKVDAEAVAQCEKERSNSLDLSSTSDKGFSSSIMESPTSDDVFECESTPIANQNEPAKRKEAVYQAPCMESFPMAPLAAMEAGSFDSDSEDSEIMTQSSDSTHSDEVRISTVEQLSPVSAWKSKQESEEQMKHKDSVME